MILKARMVDAPNIYKLLELSARQGELLPRSLSELYDCIRDFHVCLDDQNQLVACCALHPTWEELGEIRSLIVRPEMRQKGLGRRLVSQCLEEASELMINRVFVLTYNPDFFKKCGFAVISKSMLPHKIWADCVRCIHFPDCNEQALSIDLK